MSGAIVVAESEVEPAEDSETLAEAVVRTAEERGLAQVAPAKEPDPFEILDELMAQSPAFQDYVKKRAEAKVVKVQRVPRQPRDWQLDFGPVSGMTGTVTTLMIQPRCYFRGERLMVADTAEKPGTGTVILQMLVGQKLQRVIANAGTWRGVLTSFFMNGAQAQEREVKMDTCEPAFGIAVTVSFLISCTFDMTLFGKAVI